MNELVMMASSNPAFYTFIRLNPRYVLGIYRKEIVFQEVFDEFRVVTHQTFGDKMEQVGQMCSVAQMLF